MSLPWLHGRRAFILGISAALCAIAPSGLAQASPRAPVSASLTRTHTQAAAPDASFSCSGTDNSSSRRCYFYTYNENAPVFNSGGTVGTILAPVTYVEVSCWYYGNPPSPYLSDGVQDHVVWTQATGSISGHIPDAYINEGGLYPYDSPYDIAECS